MLDGEGVGWWRRICEEDAFGLRPGVDWEAFRGEGGEVEKDMARVRLVVVERRGDDGVAGGSPKTKNLMKAPIRRTMLSWPRMKP